MFISGAGEIFLQIEFTLRPSRCCCSMNNFGFVRRARNSCSSNSGSREIHARIQRPDAYKLNAAPLLPFRCSPRADRFEIDCRDARWKMLYYCTSVYSIYFLNKNNQRRLKLKQTVEKLLISCLPLPGK